MKKVIVIFTGILLGAALYIWQDPQLKKRVLHQAEDIVTPETTTVYKWQDQDGNPVISNTPPSGNIPYETIDYHRDANVMPSEEEKKRKK